jgi:hypothetical protein
MGGAKNPVHQIRIKCISGLFQGKKIIFNGRQMLHGFFHKNLHQIILGERHNVNLFLSNTPAAGILIPLVDPNQIAI